jgi:hypothetical protein
MKLVDAKAVKIFQLYKDMCRKYEECKLEKENLANQLSQSEAQIKTLKVYRIHYYYKICIQFVKDDIETTRQTYEEQMNVLSEHISK